MRSASPRSEAAASEHGAAAPGGSPGSLDVHLHGRRVAILFPAGENDYRLAYSGEVVDRAGPGETLLSHALPARFEPYSAEASRAFVEGLLPQGPRRLQMARELGIDPEDGFSLIAATGGDCAGAVTFLPEGTAPPDPAAEGDGPAPGAAAGLSDEELAELTLTPPPRFFDPNAGARMRFALSGVRHKLALVERPGGGWAWPAPGRPSTHVVKPESAEYPELAANEMFCTALLGEVGLPVAEAEMVTIAGRRCLVSRRFDRRGPADRCRRVHQESFHQALGVPPDAYGDYDDHPGIPDFPQACGLLRAVGAAEDVEWLLVAVLCGYAIGNGDLDGKNFSLLLEEGGRTRLAPLYDVVSTAVYDDPLHLGMVIPEDYSATAYIVELARLAEACEIELDDFRDLATGTARQLAHGIDRVAERARREGWHAPVVDSIAELTAERAFGLEAELES